MKKTITTSAVIAALIFGGSALVFATSHETCATTEETIVTECDQEDICPNIDGIQSEVPEGLIKNDNGECIEPPEEQPPTETPPVETPPVEEAPVDEAPVVDGK